MSDMDIQAFLAAQKRMAEERRYFNAAMNLPDSSNSYAAAQDLFKAEARFEIAGRTLYEALRATYEKGKNESE